MALAVEEAEGKAGPKLLKFTAHRGLTVWPLLSEMTRPFSFWENIQNINFIEMLYVAFVLILLQYMIQTSYERRQLLIRSVSQTCDQQALTSS